MSLKDHLWQEGKPFYLKLIRILTSWSMSFNRRTSYANIARKRILNNIFHQWGGWVPWLKYREINSGNESVAFNAGLNFCNVDGSTLWCIECFPVPKPSISALPVRYIALWFIHKWSNYLNIWPPPIIKTLSIDKE